MLYSLDHLPENSLNDWDAAVQDHVEATEAEAEGRRVRSGRYQGGLKEELGEGEREREQRQREQCAGGSEIDDEESDDESDGDEEEDGDQVAEDGQEGVMSGESDVRERPRLAAGLG